MKFGQWKEIQETLGASLSSLSSLSETFLRSKENCHGPLSFIEQNEENTTNNALDTPFPPPTIPLQEKEIQTIQLTLQPNIKEKALKNKHFEDKVETKSKGTQTQAKVLAPVDSADTSTTLNKTGVPKVNTDLSDKKT